MLFDITGPLFSWLSIEKNAELAAKNWSAFATVAYFAGDRGIAKELFTSYLSDRTKAKRAAQDWAGFRKELERQSVNPA